MKQGVMSLINLDLAVFTLIAFSIGFAVRVPARSKLGLCLLVATVGWSLRALAILNGDATIGEDYFNELTVGVVVVELAVALAWTGLWCGLGIALAKGKWRRKPEAH